MKTQVDPSHYFASAYDSKERFCGYWHQLSEIMATNPSSVLEIGIGNGFLSRLLRDRGLNLCTIDLDGRLEPDIVGDACHLPFEDDSFDVVACYEVLEHLPFDEFAGAISELHRVTRLHAIISLPDAGAFIKIAAPRTRTAYFALQIPVPAIVKQPHVFDGEHYWEIGKSGYPLKRILDELGKARFSVLRTYRLRENPYHRFFVLKKRS